MIRPCDACGGVYYDGETCRFCERLEAAYKRGLEDMRERAADLCGEAINAVRPTGRWDPEVRGAQNEAERLERAIRDLEV